jgi:hypothetical protein
MLKAKPIDPVTMTTEQVLYAWGANPAFSLGDLTRDDVKAKLEGLRTAVEQIKQLRAEVETRVDGVNAQVDELTRSSGAYAMDSAPCMARIRRNSNKWAAFA